MSLFCCMQAVAPPPPPAQPQPATSFSLILGLTGSSLVPWSISKASQTLAAVTQVLGEAGLAVNGKMKYMGSCFDGKSLTSTPTSA